MNLGVVYQLLLQFDLILLLVRAFTLQQLLFVVCFLGGQLLLFVNNRLRQGPAFLFETGAQLLDGPLVLRNYLFQFSVEPVDKFAMSVGSYAEFPFDDAEEEAAFESLADPGPHTVGILFNNGQFPKDFIRAHFVKLDSDVSIFFQRLVDFDLPLELLVELFFFDDPHFKLFAHDDNFFVDELSYVIVDHFCGIKILDVDVLVAMDSDVTRHGQLLFQLQDVSRVVQPLARDELVAFLELRFEELELLLQEVDGISASSTCVLEAVRINGRRS